MEIILGIDPGTQILGYSLLRIADGKPSMMLMDVLYLKKMKDFHLRLHKIFTSTTRLIDLYHPDHLAIEAPFFGKNVQSMIKLGKAQGIAIAAALSRDLSYSEYEPASVKQIVTGNGAASKEQVAMMLGSIFNIEAKPEYLDATDALAVAYACYMEQSNPYAELQAELRASKRKPKRKSWSDFVNENPDRINF